MVFETTLEVKCKLYGKDDTDLADSHLGIARCLRRLERHAEAASHRRRCWELESAEDGPAASGTLQTAAALAKDLIQAKDAQAARLVIKDALKAAKSAHDEDEDCAEQVQRLEALLDSMKGES